MRKSKIGVRKIGVPKSRRVAARAPPRVSDSKRRLKKRRVIASKASRRRSKSGHVAKNPFKRSKPQPKPRPKPTQKPKPVLKSVRPVAPKKVSKRRVAVNVPTRRRSAGPDVLNFIILALDKRWNDYLGSLRRYQQLASVKNVHDLRVSIRRLTTTIDLIDRFNPDNIVRQARVKLKDQLKELSVLRDVHIEMVRTSGFLKELPEMKEFYDELRDRETKYLKSANKIPWKSDRRFIENSVNRARIRLNVRCATTTAENSHRIVDASLDVSFDNLSKKLESVTPADYGSIHRVRLAFKPLRYTIEMLQPVVGLESRQLRTATLLARLMGQIQDLEVLMKDLVEFRWKKENVPGAVVEIWLDLERRKIEATERFLRSIPKFGTIWKPIIHEQTGVASSASKTLFILRHGIAVTRGDAAYPLDSDRPLTMKGMKRLRRIAKGLHRLSVQFDLILTSPYRRALETAFVVGREYGVGQIIQTSQALRPEVLPEEAIRAVQEKYSPCRRLLMVGHEPQLSALISTLTTGSASARPLLKKGSVCKLQVEKLQMGKCATLIWLLTPRQLINMA